MLQFWIYNVFNSTTKKYEAGLDLFLKGNKFLPQNLIFLPDILATQCDIRVSRSQAKIDENFANYFLKTKANN